MVDCSTVTYTAKPRLPDYGGKPCVHRGPRHPAHSPGLGHGHHTDQFPARVCNTNKLTMGKFKIIT